MGVFLFSGVVVAEEDVEVVEMEVVVEEGVVDVEEEGALYYLFVICLYFWVDSYRYIYMF